MTPFNLMYGGMAVRKINESADAVQAALDSSEEYHAGEVENLQRRFDALATIVGNMLDHMEVKNDDLRLICGLYGHSVEDIHE